MQIPFKLRMLLLFLKYKKGINIYDMTPEQARQVTSTVSNQVDLFIEYPAIPLYRIFDRNIEGRDSLIPIRIYQPLDQKDLPTILYFHGGGFVINDLDSHDKVCRRIARDNRAVVIAVDYRLAPEYPFPAATHDAYDATVWASAHSAIHGGDPAQLIVMGDSAGANLATVVCLMARNENGPIIKQQLLIYPCTDARLKHPSIDKFAEGFLLTKKIMKWFMQHYVPDPSTITHPYVSPLLAQNLSNLPPTWIATAAYDPLRDEGQLYAQRLKQAGNQVFHKEYPGMIHGFFALPRLSRTGLLIFEDIKAAIRNGKS